MHMHASTSSWPHLLNSKDFIVSVSYRKLSCSCMPQLLALLSHQKSFSATQRKFSVVVAGYAHKVAVQYFFIFTESPDMKRIWRNNLRKVARLLGVVRNLQVSGTFL